MTLKSKIMKEVDKSDCEYFELQKRVSPANLDKFMVAVDDLGIDGYLSYEAIYKSFIISKKNIASYVRYKRDCRKNIAEWFIKIASFAIVIVTLLLTV